MKSKNGSFTMTTNISSLALCNKQVVTPGVLILLMMITRVNEVSLLPSPSMRVVLEICVAVKQH